MSTSEDGDVPQHFLATVTKTRGLDREHVKCAAQFVHHEGGQGFTVNIFRYDDEVLGNLQDLLKDRENVRNGGDFLVRDKDERVRHRGFHTVRVGHEVW